MKYNLIIFLLLAAASCCAQGVISLSKMNAVSIGFDNPLKIAIEDVNCEDVILTTGTGKQVEGGGCLYTFYPQTLSDTIIDISVKTTTGVKHIGSTTFRIKRGLESGIYLGEYIGNGGVIESSSLKMQVIPKALFINIDLESHIVVCKYNVIVTRDDDIIFEQQHDNEKGAVFDNRTRNFFA